MLLTTPLDPRVCASIAAGKLDSACLPSFFRILLTGSSALAGRRSNRYFRDSGMNVQAIKPIASVTPPPNQNMPRQPKSGKMKPATTDVIIAPSG